MEEKIEPNKAYTINKMNFAAQAGVMAKICMTLKDFKKEPIDPYIFLEQVSKAVVIDRCIIFVSFNEEQELNCCAVVYLKRVPIKGKILWIEWAWTDGKNLNIGKKVFERIEDLAQKLEVTRIACAMTKGFRGVFKKYGFKEAYRVLEKEVKKIEHEKD